MSMRLGHVITGLGAGGAEFMLLRLCAALARDYQLKVVSLTSGGPLATQLRARGVPVVELGVRGIFDVPRGLVALRRALQGPLRPMSCRPGCVMPICLVAWWRVTRSACR